MKAGPWRCESSRFRQQKLPFCLVKAALSSANGGPSAQAFSPFYFFIFLLFRWLHPSGRWYRPLHRTTWEDELLETLRLFFLPFYPFTFSFLPFYLLFFTLSPSPFHPFTLLSFHPFTFPSTLVNLNSLSLGRTLPGTGMETRHPFSALSTGWRS